MREARNVYSDNSAVWARVMATTAPKNSGTFDFTDTACVDDSMRRTTFVVAINSNCCLNLVLVYACSSSE